MSDHANESIPSVDDLPLTQQLDLATEAVYRTLAAALTDPHIGGVDPLRDPASQRLACCAADLLRDEFADRPMTLAMGERPSDEMDARPLIDQFNATRLDDEFVRVFGLVSCRECPPYETDYYRSGEVFFRSQQMADAAGFFRAFGLDVASHWRERPDYLPLELEFVALLLTKKRLAGAAGEQADICQRARESFFRDHLSWWVPSFAVALERKAQHGFYAAAARLLGALVAIERTRLDVPPPAGAPRTPDPAAQEDNPCAACG